jgi:glycyl-tRNA synthetase beta chain
MKQAAGHELFIEIGVEEMPSHLIPTALSDLKKNAEKQLAAASLAHAPFCEYATPRRLILYTPQLAARQASRVETVLGPPAKVAFDPKGKPTQAAIGFARANGVSLSQLVVTKTEKGDYLSIQKKTASQATPTLLKTMIPEMIGALRFAKSMRWNGPVAFIRPIRWLVALYNQKVVPCVFAQIQSGNLSYGHRLVAPDGFKVGPFSSYQKEMRKRFVIIDPMERYNTIRKQIGSVAQKAGGAIEEDNTLFWQAAHSTEYPTAICGSFDPSFLSIPKEIISTAMKEHQGFLPLLKEKNLQPHFIAVLNNKDKNKTIQKGNERVLRARLSDAKFYFDEDRKVPLQDRLPALKGVLFQKGLGTLYDKTQRIIALSRFIAPRVDPKLPEKEVEQMATLCKCDLTTGVVREFPSLQGIMGRILMESESPHARAIEEHYQPRYPGDPLPPSVPGQILSLADKLDTIVGCFGIGAIPTGSEDPYALRRQGLGIIQILSEKSFDNPVTLMEVTDQAIAGYQKESGIALKPETSSEVVSFLKQRIDFYLHSEKIRYDIINAVLARDSIATGGMTGNIVKLAKALADFSGEELFRPLITCYKRAARILPEKFEGNLDRSFLTTGADLVLYDTLLDLGKTVDEHIKKQAFGPALRALSDLYHPLDRFFTEVLVMDPRHEIQSNNLCLLRIVKNLFDRLGDFSKIQEGGMSDG